MVESYGIRGGTRRSSRKSIQEMKKNMKKVPIIQEKSHAYHQKEKEQADEILTRVDEQSQPIYNQTQQYIKQNATSLREYIQQKIRFIFGNKS